MQSQLVWVQWYCAYQCPGQVSTFFQVFERILANGTICHGLSFKWWKHLKLYLDGECNAEFYFQVSKKHHVHEHLDVKWLERQVTDLLGHSDFEMFHSCSQNTELHQHHWQSSSSSVQQIFLSLHFYIPQYFIPPFILFHLAAESVPARIMLIEYVNPSVYKERFLSQERNKCQAGEMLTLSHLQSSWHRWPTQSSKTKRSNSYLGLSESTSVLKVCVM